MVTKITVPHSLRQALLYNEQKVEKGQAACLHAAHYFLDAGQLSFRDKLQRLEDLAARNQRARTNSVHLTLNFAPGEGFSKEKLVAIACSFMQKIGFGDQPYLVYEHRDSGHPHLHVVTTNIQADGRRISLHGLGRHAANQARQEVEKTFHLRPAGAKQTEPVIPATPIQKVVYGTGETRDSVARVVQHVTTQYHYQNLEQFNAVLRLFGVTAERGCVGSRMYQNGGLLYRALDASGQARGVPLKASTLPGKPTLAFLAKQFGMHQNVSAEYQRQLQTTLDWCLLQQPKNGEQLTYLMQQENISLVVQQGGTGNGKRLTFIDHNTHQVFGAEDLALRPHQGRWLERFGALVALQQTLRPHRLPADTEETLKPGKKQTYSQHL